MPRGRFLRRARAGSPSRRTGRSARGCRGQAARARIARPLRGGVLSGVASRSRRPLIPSPGDAYRRGQPFVPRVLPPCVPWLRRVRPARGPFPPRGGEAPRPSGVLWLAVPLGDAPSFPRGDVLVRLVSLRLSVLRVRSPCVPSRRRVRPARGPFPPRGGEALRPSGVPWLPAPLCDVLSSSRDSSTLALERPKLRQIWRFAILDGKPERRRAGALGAWWLTGPEWAGGRRARAGDAAA